jgi:hypothetical protein
MKTIAYLVAVGCVIAAGMYFVLPGGSLPTFMPGYVPGSTHVHKMHGIAAVIAAVIFVLIALTRRQRSI